MARDKKQARMGKHKRPKSDSDSDTGAKHKRPKSDSESDSDSGPEDRNVPAKNASKSSGASGSVGKKNSEGDTYFDLEKNKRVTIREFKNKIYIDVREFYEKDGKTLPGKKGIALSTTQWNMLKDLVPCVDQAIQELC